MNTELTIAEKLKAIEKTILEKIQVKSIYLFGSYAYGNPNENSDINIYAVVPDNVENDILLTTGKIAYSLYKQHIYKVDLFLVRERNFLDYKQYSSFEQHICEKGVLLYG